MSTPKKPGTDLAALKARLAKKNQQSSAPAAAPGAAPAPAGLPPPGHVAPPNPSGAGAVPAPGATGPTGHAPPSAQAPQAAGGSPLGGGPGAFDPSAGVLDAGGDVPTRGNNGLTLFAALVGIGVGALGGYFGSGIARNGEAQQSAAKKGAQMLEAVTAISNARKQVSVDMEALEAKMATDPTAAAAELDTLLKEQFEPKVDVDQLFGWQLAAVHSKGVRRTFELFDETTRLQNDLGYLSAFLSTQANALKAAGGPSQFAVKYTDKGAVLVAALQPMCGNPSSPTPCAPGKTRSAVAYQVLENLGGKPTTLPRGTGPGQVTLVRSSGAVYDYAVGMEPKRNALIMRNALLARAKEHLEAMSKAEKAAIKALENYAANPSVDGGTPQPDPEG